MSYAWLLIVDSELFEFVESPGESSLVIAASPKGDMAHSSHQNTATENIAIENTDAIFLLLLLLLLLMLMILMMMLLQLMMLLLLMLMIWVAAVPCCACSVDCMTEATHGLD